MWPERLARRICPILRPGAGGKTLTSPAITRARTAWLRPCSAASPAAGRPDDVLCLAASLDQASRHVLASAVVRAATERNCQLVLPDQVEEIPGQGIRGVVGGRRVTVGKAAWAGVTGAPPWARTARRQARLDGALTVFVTVDGQPAGVLVLDDPVRPDAGRTIRALRRGGISRIVMVNCDRAEVARSVGAVIGVDEVLAERTPAEKLDAVRLERRRAPTIMVGDGINDAPALALADVGARGAPPPRRRPPTPCSPSTASTGSAR
jgi:cation transport ATPase